MFRDVEQILLWRRKKIQCRRKKNSLIGNKMLSVLLKHFFRWRWQQLFRDVEKKWVTSKNQFRDVEKIFCDVEKQFRDADKQIRDVVQTKF